MNIIPKPPVKLTDIGAVAGFVGAVAVSVLLVRWVAKKFGAPASVTP